MDLEKAMQFIVERQAQTEAILQQSAEEHKRLEASHVLLGESLITLTDIVRQVAEAQQRHEEQFQRHREEDEAFHREVDERFNALIKMMDEWIRNQRKGKGAS